MLLCDIPNYGCMIRQTFFLQTQLSNIPPPLESCTEVPLRCLTLTLWPWISPDLPYRFLLARSVWIFQCFIPYSSLHTTDTFHEFVLFSYAVSNNIKPSTVSTDHFVCYYINWTDILQNEIVLWLQDVSGPGSVVGIGTAYELDGSGIESRWCEIFRTCPDRPWGPPSLLYNGYWVFPGGNLRPGRDADPAPPSSAEV